MLRKIIIYGDYICPFCYIGQKRVDQLEEQFGIEVEWKGLEIHPETPPESEEAGLKLNLRSWISNSRLALQIGEFAKEKGKFKEYHEAVFKAYWQESKEIGHKEQLFSVAVQAGLDLRELETYLESGKAAGKLNQHLQEVSKYGIDGVPAFIIGNKTVVGAHPYEVLEKVVKQELFSG
jgi:predicted DsbA family dithiol-disulfide isomerase